MSVGQVIAIYSERNYRRFAEDWEKLWLVPFADMMAPSYTIQGGTTQVLRGIVARGLGLR